MASRKHQRNGSAISVHFVKPDLDARTAKTPQLLCPQLAAPGDHWDRTDGAARSTHTCPPTSLQCLLAWGTCPFLPFPACAKLAKLLSLGKK